MRWLVVILLGVGLGVLAAEYATDPIRAWTSNCLLVIGVLGASIAMASGQVTSQ